MPKSPDLGTASGFSAKFDSSKVGPPPRPVTDQAPRPSQPAAKAPKATRSRPKRPVVDADSLTASSYKLEPRHIEAIREGARDERKFIYIYFDQVLNGALDSLSGPVPAPPRSEGPSDYRYDRVFTVKTSAGLLRRLRDVDTEDYGVSHVVRFLLDETFPAGAGG